MANELTDIFSISGSALKAQDQRMKVIAENIANASTTASSVGGKPYQRQTITFKNEFDKALGAYKVTVGSVQPDKSEFTQEIRSFPSYGRCARLCHDAERQSAR